MANHLFSSPVRVNPFTGLIVDVDTWSTAHDYHRHHHQLHLLTLHGCGIAHGLEVLPTDPPSDTVVVEHGVGIDRLGNVIILPERQRLSLEAKEGTLYLSLDYVESVPPGTSTNQAGNRGRVVEDFRLRVLSVPPELPALELARVQMGSSAKADVTSPSNPWSPGPNEIDSRFRLRVQPQACTDVHVGLLVCGSAEELDPNHLKGFHHLLRALAGCGLRAVLVGAGGREGPPADILYVTGKGTAKPTAAVLNRVSEQVKQRAWLFVDACGPGTELIEGLQAAVKEDKKGSSETEDAALGAHFVFGTAPPGASPSGEISWARSAVISARDYGCAWAGRHAKQVLSREEIRSALEFGVNVAVCASRRKSSF
jgi:hypothetical protein